MKALAMELLWKRYRESCYGTAVISETQERETRQAFYAGALNGFTVVSEIASLPEEQAVTLTEIFYQEMKAGCKENAVSNFRHQN